MDKFLLNFKKSYILVFVSILIGIIALYIDSKINTREISKKHYIKLSLVIGIISTFIIYIHNIKGKIEEEILTGTVPF